MLQMLDKTSFWIPMKVLRVIRVIRKAMLNYLEKWISIITKSLISWNEFVFRLTHFVGWTGNLKVNSYMEMVVSL